MNVHIMKLAWTSAEPLGDMKKLITIASFTTLTLYQVFYSHFGFIAALNYMPIL